MSAALVYAILVVCGALFRNWHSKKSTICVHYVVHKDQITHVTWFSACTLTCVRNLGMSILVNYKRAFLAVWSLAVAMS